MSSDRVLLLWHKVELRLRILCEAFEAQNKMVDAGGIDAGTNRIRIESTGNFYSLDDIRDLTIVSRNLEEHFRLADIAQYRRRISDSSG